ncbi:MAG: hypothetical protein R3E84_07940 [Pseudomonadales bacterium]
MKKPKFSLRRQISVDPDNRAVPLNLLEYVTWGIFGTFALTVVAAYSSWSLIANAFGSGAVLNGTIISIAVIGVGRSIWSNASPLGNCPLYARDRPGEIAKRATSGERIQLVPLAAEDHGQTARYKADGGLAGKPAADEAPEHLRTTMPG